MLRLLTKILAVGALIIYPALSYSELVIEITQGIEKAIPIAVVPFAWQAEGHNSAQLTTTIKANLNRSGFFKTLPERDMFARPTNANHIKYKNWQVLGQEYLVIGQVKEVAGDYQIQFQLFNVYSTALMLNYRMKAVKKDNIRRAAHHISDLIYEKLTGRKGVFTTRLAYVTHTRLHKKRSLYELLVADADGFSPKTITSSSEPLMSPAWSPDGKKIAYVSFENDRPAIFIQTLASGSRLKVAFYRGINGAPAFSPDGKRLALTLSKDGNPDIYVLDLVRNSLTKITKSYGIDTEATWSPDGESIVYTSNRGGTPQLYIIPSQGGTSERLTFEGKYNTRGRFSNDGKSLAMVHGNSGDYRIAVMDMKTRLLNVLTAGSHDESPSFSPNDSMLLFAAKNKQGKSILAAVTAGGSKIQQNMTFSSGDVREPAWSPY